MSAPPRALNPSSFSHSPLFASQGRKQPDFCPFSLVSIAPPRYTFPSMALNPAKGPGSLSPPSTSPASKARKGSRAKGRPGAPKPMCERLKVGCSPVVSGANLKRQHFQEQEARSPPQLEVVGLGRGCPTLVPAAPCPENLHAFGLPLLVHGIKKGMFS